MLKEQLIEVLGTLTEREQKVLKLLGMGDMMSLIEKAEAVYDDEQAARMEKKLKKNQFTLEDFLDQIGQIRNMGGLTSLIKLIPGVQGKIKDMDFDRSEKEFAEFEAIIQSMTPKERKDPSILNASRRKRIQLRQEKGIT